MFIIVLLQFVGIRESDAGRYICRASNFRAVLESSADVIVNGDIISSNIY